MAAPPIVKRLVDRFLSHRESYQAAHYNEAQLRQEFLNPLFKALGWDVDNEQGHAEAYKDVIHEDAIKVGGATKAPDYCFRIGGRRIFFLEAKKPSVSVRDDVSAAFQLRRYAWSAKLPLSILSDFEELAVYDCRIRPDKSDKPSVGRVLFLKCEEYIDKWDELAGIFSRDAVLKGSFDKFAESNKQKRGTAQVDAAFLEEIEQWRDSLARNFALRNSDLSQRDLNFAVQRTIDRIIFLRMCEDRGIEPYGQLAGLQNGEAVYARLAQLFERADERYNSGLFHFQPEKGRAEPPDELTLSLTLDDKPLKEILRGLYYPDSPYEFSVLPAEILGAVYEQFLGKVIKLTPAHRAVVEDKPEVKKAGGVYYTPSYIVDYIVQNTVGELVEGKSPKEVAKLRILDPACGSGSFLVGAFQFLLDWHRDWYVQDGVKKHAKQVYQGPGGQWHLTTSEKKRILLNNVYGVDIDAQAVEVTKLSLLLKVLEHENRETLERQLRLLHERALPDLGNNIKCGNSLIGPDFYRGRAKALLHDLDESDVNAFEWRHGFPTIVRGGGFSAIIGNPPYIDIIGIPAEQRKYFAAAYKTFSYRSDILGVFFQKAIDLLAPNGLLGFITSNVYFASTSAEQLRRFMLDSLLIQRLIDIGGGVFADANVDTAVLIGRKKRANAKSRFLTAACRSPQDFMRVVAADPRIVYSVLQAAVAARPGQTLEVNTSPEAASLVEKIERAAVRRLESCFEFCRGFTAYDAHRGHTKKMIKDRVFHSDRRINAAYRKELVGSDISRYELTIASDLWVKFGDNLAAPRDPRFHTGPRVWIQRIRNPKLRQRLVCYYTANHSDLAASGGLTIGRSLDASVSAGAVCGLLNSPVVNWWYRQKFNDVNIKPRDLVLVPIPPGWDSHQDEIASLVDGIQSLLARAATTRAGDERAALRRKAAMLDSRIDAILNEAFGLGEQEIELIHGGAAGE